VLSINNKILEYINSFFLIVVGWIIVVPISFLIPRKKGLFAVVGRTGNNFADNTKYFYLFLQKNHPKNKSFFISDTKAFGDEVPGLVKHHSFKSAIILMRAEYVVLDYSAWYLNFKYYLSIKAKKIQLWHGIGSKRIEMSTDIFTKSKFGVLRKVFGALRGQIIKYSLLSSTSEYYSTNLYKGSLWFKEIKEFGQPRNDVLFRTPDNADLIGADSKVIVKLKEKKRNNNTIIVLFTPTYRATLSNDIIEPELQVDEDKMRIKKQLERSIDELELSVRSFNCLQAAQIKSIADLVSKEENEMLRFKNFGRKSLNELIAKLDELGLRFGMDLGEFIKDPLKSRDLI